MLSCSLCQPPAAQVILMYNIDRKLVNVKEQHSVPDRSDFRQRVLLM